MNYKIQYTLEHVRCSVHFGYRVRSGFRHA